MRHGGTFVRVSPNRLIPAGSHSYDETPAQNETTSTSETLQDNDTDSQYEIIGLHSENHEVGRGYTDSTKSASESIVVGKTHAPEK